MKGTTLIFDREDGSYMEEHTGGRVWSADGAMNRWKNKKESRRLNPDVKWYGNGEKFNDDRIISLAFMLIDNVRFDWNV